LKNREKQFEIIRVTPPTAERRADVLAVEEPLEIRLVYGPTEARKSRSLAVTMRTPGHDAELACGFLVSEGIVKKRDDILTHRFCGPPANDQNVSNLIEIELTPDVAFEFAKLQRNFYTTSSCGICGKASLEAIKADNVQRVDSPLVISKSVVFALASRLRERQTIFETTGGLHGAGIANRDGTICSVGEDIGRHNAVDKLIGRQLLLGHLPLHEKILVLSGRASFELMQKALLASIPIVVAVGAPSSLAAELALEFGQTLIGFSSQSRFNIYAGQQRIAM
jgi:FdhD protein